MGQVAGGRIGSHICRQRGGTVHKPVGIIGQIEPLLICLAELTAHTAVKT